MRRRSAFCRTATAALGILLLGAVVGRPAALRAQQPPTSYSPVVMQEDFDKTIVKMAAAKPEIMERQMELLHERYDLSDRPAKGVTMSRGKPVQEGVRAKLPGRREVVGRLGGHDARGDPPEGSVAQGLLAPAASQPCGRRDGLSQVSHRKIKKQEGRDLTRFDLDFDLPDALPARISAAPSS